MSIYLFIWSFLGLLKPLCKKIHCTVQNSLNRCSIIDSAVYLECSPNFESPYELIVQSETFRSLCSTNCDSPNVLGSPNDDCPNVFVVQSEIVQT